MSYNTILATTPLTSTGYHLKATGTTIGNSLIWDNGTNVGIGNTNTSYTLDVTGNSRFTTGSKIATASGQLLVGSNTSTIGTALEVVGDIYASNKIYGVNGTAANPAIRFFAGASGLYSTTGDDLGISTNGASRLYISSAGNVGIGIVPQTWSTVYKSLQVGNASLLCDASSNTYTGTNTYIGSDAQWKYISNAPASIAGLETNSWVFYNAASGTTGGNISWTERMRITSGGLVGINTTSALSGYSPVLQATSSTVNTAAVFNITATSSQSMPAVVISKPDSTTSTAQVFVYFLVGSTGGSGQINANGSSQAAFGALSDIRLKENITTIPSQLPNILKLKPCEFDYKDGSGHQIGFIAQEIKEIYPDAVSETKDGFLTVTGWNKTEAYLVKAIQEMNTKLDEQNQTIQNLQEQINILSK